MKSFQYLSKSMNSIFYVSIKQCKVYFIFLLYQLKNLQNKNRIYFETLSIINEQIIILGGTPCTYHVPTFPPHSACVFSLLFLSTPSLIALHSLATGNYQSTILFGFKLFHSDLFYGQICTVWRKPHKLNLGVRVFAQLVTWGLYNLGAVITGGHCNRLEKIRRLKNDVDCYKLRFKTTIFAVLNNLKNFTRLVIETKTSQGICTASSNVEPIINCN